MSTDKAIVYDHSCPMCRWYTGAFVKADLLRAENRISFHELETSKLHTQLDLHRSKHEIPLLDLNGGATIYGLDSLVYLLGKRFPIIPRLMRFRPVRAFFEVFYQLVSYNRRIIAASPKTEGTFDCTPDFHLAYRLSYILLASVIAWILWSTAWPLLPVSHWAKALILVPFLPSLFLKLETGISWAGHWSTVLLIGALLLLPVLIGIGGVWWWGTLTLAVMLWQIQLRVRMLAS